MDIVDSVVSFVGAEPLAALCTLVAASLVRRFVPTKYQGGLVATAEEIVWDALRLPNRKRGGGDHKEE